MTHLPFIVAAYLLGTGVPIAYAVAATLRAGTARRRLSAAEAIRGQA